MHVIFVFLKRKSADPSACERGLSSSYLDFWFLPYPSEQSDSTRHQCLRRSRSRSRSRSRREAPSLPFPCGTRGRGPGGPPGGPPRGGENKKASCFFSSFFQFPRSLLDHFLADVSSFLYLFFRGLFLY